MTAAAVAAAPAFTAGARIALLSITPSKTNQRKRFDEGKLAELAESVKKHDILQPILVRPNGTAGKYELIAGERRFRAAKIAGLVDIPAIVRELTDAEALEVQVIENLQREGLHELEEAEGYEQLLKCAHPDGRKYSVDEIASKVGKSRSYIYMRLKLTSLCKKARDAFYTDKLDYSKALLIARIVGEDLQLKALDEISRVDHWSGASMSFKKAQEYVQREFMLRLGGAPFPIADVDLVKAAGACGACPKRTGNQPELFADVKATDVCTDPACFSSKREAHVVRLAAAAKKNGQEVITGKEARKLMPYGGRQDMKGYIALDEKCYDDPKARTYRQLLAKDLPAKPTLVEASDGALFEAVKQKDVADLLKTIAPKRTTTSSSNDSYRKSQKAAEQKAKNETEIRMKIHGLIRAKVVDGLTRAELAAVALAFYQDIWHENRDRVTKLWADPEAAREKPKKRERMDGFEQRIEAMTEAELPRLLIDLALIKASHVGTYGNPGTEALYAIAKGRGINVEKVRKELQTEQRSRAAAKRPKKGKAGKGTKA